MKFGIIALSLFLHSINSKAMDFSDGGLDMCWNNGDRIECPSFEGGGGYDAPMGIDSGSESVFSGHDWYTDPKSPPQGPPFLYKYFILTKPRTEIEQEKYYALSRIYPNDRLDKERCKAYNEYNAWVIVERKRVKAEEDAKAYKAENDRRITDNIELSKRQVEESRLANEKLEAEMAPQRLQHAQDDQRRWDNWRNELAEKEASRLAQQEIDIARFAEIDRQRVAAWTIQQEERVAKEKDLHDQKEAASGVVIKTRYVQRLGLTNTSESQGKTVRHTRIPTIAEEMETYQFVSPDSDFKSELSSLYERLNEFQPESDTQTKSKELGLFSVRESDIQYSKGEIIEAAFWKDIAGESLDIALGLNPTTGLAQSAYELIMGKSFVTGEDIGRVGRSFAFLGVVTLGGSKSVGAVTRAMDKIYKGASNILRDRNAYSIAIYEGTLLVQKAGRVLNEWGKGHKITHIEEAAAANARLGGKPPYLSGSYLIHFVTQAEAEFTRVHMGYNEARSWLVKRGEIVGLNPTQIRDKLNLLETPTHVSETVVPKGVSMSRGTTNYNEWTWNGMGERIEGQVQYRIESEVKHEWFSNMKEIGEVFK